MKKAIVMIVALAGIFQVTNAQCAKKVKWTSSHTTFIDSSGNKNRDQDEPVEITITNGQVSILPNQSSDDEMNGPVTDYLCKWTDKKNGSTSFKALVTDTHGDTKHIFASIKGDGDKITIKIFLEEMGGLTVLLNGVSFEENN